MWSSLRGSYSILVLLRDMNRAKIRFYVMTTIFPFSKAEVSLAGAHETWPADRGNNKCAEQRWIDKGHRFFFNTWG